MTTLAASRVLDVSADLDVLVAGSVPGAEVVLEATSTATDGLQWRSWATFVAGNNGTVDVARDPALSGSYLGIDANGLLWSMVTDPPALGAASTVFTSIENRDVAFTVPGTGAEPLVVTISHLRDGVRREPLDPTRTCGVVGDLFLPQGPDPAPCVLVVGGSGGGQDLVAAASLAGRGFVVLALAYFAVEGRPDELIDIELRYFEQALRWLQAHPATTGERPSIVGRSRGGELALVLATLFDIPTVVAYVPSGVVHSGLRAGAGGDRLSVPAWLLDGEPLPFLAHDHDITVAVPGTETGPVRAAPTTLASLTDWSRVVPAVLPLERSGSRVLLVSAGRDDLWPSALFATLAMERLRRRGPGSTARHLMLLDAGHRFLPGTIPATTNTQSHRVTGDLLSLGGTPAGNRLGGFAIAGTAAFLRGGDPADVLPDPAGRWILE